MIMSSVSAALTAGIIIVLILPVIAAVVLMIRKKISAVSFFCGFGAFTVSQIIIRMPIISLLSSNEGYISFVSTAAGLFILSLTAGLFEESARLISSRFILKNHRSYCDAVTFGFGHASAEMILLVGLTYVSYLIMVFMYNSGNLEIYLQELPAEQTDLIIQTLTDLTAASIAMGILERISSMMFHIFVTVIVFMGVRRKKAVRYWLIAIAAHTLFNYIIVLTSNYINMYAAEIFALAAAVCGIIFVIKQRSSFDKTEKEQHCIEQS